MSIGELNIPADSFLGHLAYWSAVFGIVGAVWTLLFRKVVPWLRAVTRFIDDWTGEPERPGFKARPGIPERLEAVEHELHPNNGESLRDAIDRIEHMVTAMHSTPPVPPTVVVTTTPHQSEEK